MAAEDARPPVTRVRDGRKWRIGTDAEVAWINDGTSITSAITAAIPALFAAYCTLELPTNWEEEQERHDRAVIARLTEHSEEQPWWLGYLDTGADDVIFADAPTVLLYEGWDYVLVEAGPEQAATWRSYDEGTFWKGVLPNLMFPADRSWLVSTRWDDEWTCIGGSEELVASFVRHPDLGIRARRVALGQDATPPGHRAQSPLPPRTTQMPGEITERLIVMNAGDGSRLILGMQFASPEHELRLVFQHEGHGDLEPLRRALNPLWVTIGGERRVVFAGDNLDEPDVDRVVLSTPHAVGTECRLLPVRHWRPVWMSFPEPSTPGEPFKPGSVTAWWLAGDRVVHKVETPPLEWGMRYPEDPPESPPPEPSPPSEPGGGAGSPPA